MKKNQRRNRKHRENRKKEEFNLAYSKISFVSGIVLCMTIIKGICRSQNISQWISSTQQKMINIFLAIIAAGLLFILLKKDTFDEWMKRKQVAEFGCFMTIASIGIFCFDNLTEFSGIPLHDTILVVLTGLEIIGGTFFLLRSK